MGISLLCACQPARFVLAGFPISGGCMVKKPSKTGQDLGEVRRRAAAIRQAKQDGRISPEEAEKQLHRLAHQGDTWIDRLLLRRSV